MENWNEPKIIKTFQNYPVLFNDDFYLNACLPYIFDEEIHVDNDLTIHDISDEEVGLMEFEERNDSDDDISDDL